MKFRILFKIWGGEKMRKKICLLLAICYLLSLTGCAGITKSVKSFDKKMVVPPFPQWRRHYWEDKELWGNQGNFPKGYAARKVPAPVEETVEEIIYPEVEIIEEEPIVIMEEEMPQPRKKELPATYKVKKGDCLWFIAGYPEIYGNPLMWPKIYEANRDKIKDPDLIYPNQIFIIPREESSLEIIEYEK